MNIRSIKGNQLVFDSEEYSRRDDILMPDKFYIFSYIIACVSIYMFNNPRYKLCSRWWHTSF